MRNSRSVTDLTDRQRIGVFDLSADSQEAAALSARLGVPLISNGQWNEFELLLGCDENGLSGIAFAADFSDRRPPARSDRAWFLPSLRPRPGSLGRDPLLRAIGHQTGVMIDTTAGWCVDAMQCAAQGLEVHAIERHPVVHALLTRALQCDGTLSLYCADSVDWLEQTTIDAEVIYLDPMYPEKPGSAATRRPMQLLQALHGDPDTAQDPVRLLAIARRRASRRVVVKRPHHAPPLGPGASGSIDARLVRFDLYPPAN